MMEKICRKCGPKPVEEFHKHRSTKDGLRPYCRTCAAALVANYRKFGTTTKGSFSLWSEKRIEETIEKLQLELKRRKERV